MLMGEEGTHHAGKIGQWRGCASIHEDAEIVGELLLGKAQILQSREDHGTERGIRLEECDEFPHRHLAPLTECENPTSCRLSYTSSGRKFTISI